MPPPSSGGVHLVQMLNMLEKDDVAGMGAGSASHISLLTETMKRAYADRFAFLGDPDSIKVPVKGLTSKIYAQNLRATLNLEKPTPSSEIKPANPLPFESDQTTHYSVVDKEGNAVSTTYTLNFSYGLGLVAEGTGVLLNNELDDFAAKAGAINAYGLMQGDSNLPGGGKRPLSSMTPTIMLKDGKVFMVTGSPGGSRIITMVLNSIMNVVDFNMNIAESVAFPRFHHQWQPDAIDVESGFSPDTLNLLTNKGYKLTPRMAFGSINAIHVTKDGIMGAADPRQRGTLAMGH
jgi:gamma-glutamyltranspeptidase/glutathione hydrolase